MAKGSGTTRAGSSASPKGFALMTGPGTGGAYNSRSDMEDIAQRLYDNGGLTIDPGDATYEYAATLAMITKSGIENSIEGTTDYTAQAADDYVQVWSNSLNPGNAMNEWGTDDMVRIPYGNRSLMDIINELRTKNPSTIYKKYK